MSGIEHLVVGWNRSAEYFARPIYDALRRNRRIGDSVHFLGITGWEYEDTGSNVHIRSFPDIPGALDPDSLTDILPNSDVFYISVSQNPRSKHPARYVAPKIMKHVIRNREQGIDDVEGLPEKLFSLSTAWTKFAKRDRDNIMEKIKAHCSTVEAYRPHSYKAALYAVEDLIIKYMHHREVHAEKTEAELAMALVSTYKPAILNEVQLFSQLGRSDRPTSNDESEKNYNLRHELNLSAFEALKMNRLLGARRLVTMTAHSALQMAAYHDNDIEFVNLSGLEQLMHAFADERLDMDNMVVVSPDEGGIRDAFDFARKLYKESNRLDEYDGVSNSRQELEPEGYDGLVVVMEKKRGESNIIESMNLSQAFQYDEKTDDFGKLNLDDPDVKESITLKLKGGLAVIVDDIIDTFGTGATAIELINKDYGSEVVMAGYQAILSDPATYLMGRLHKEEKLRKVFISDTIKHTSRDWQRIFGVQDVFKREILRLFRFDRSNGVYVPRKEFLGENGQ